MQAIAHDEFVVMNGVLAVGTHRNARIDQQVERGHARFRRVALFVDNDTHVDAPLACIGEGAHTDREPMRATR